MNAYDFNPVAPVLTPVQAWAIDTKIDDGMPMSGAVRATMGFYQCNGQTVSGPCFNTPYTRTTPGGVQACVDATVTPNVYWTTPSYTAAPQSLYSGINIGLCEIDVPVD
jgi:hypothetical protein